MSNSIKKKESLEFRGMWLRVTQQLSHAKSLAPDERDLFFRGVAKEALTMLRDDLFEQERRNREPKS